MNLSTPLNRINFESYLLLRYNNKYLINVLKSYVILDVYVFYLRYLREVVKQKHNVF